MATFKIVNIAKGKVGFIEPMLALAVTKLPEGPGNRADAHAPASDAANG